MQFQKGRRLNNKSKRLPFMAAWSFLFVFAGLERFLVCWFPDQVFLVAEILIVSALGIVLWQWRRFSMPKDPILIGFGVFVIIRSFFPNFDVDSLNYHLTGVRWLIEKHTLASFQHRPDGLNIHFAWLGFEDFLTIPWATRPEFPLIAGIMGGVTKLLTMGTIASIIPRATIGLRYIAVFLLLIDDHFLFSGQNRFVFINPALIGLFAASMWLAWRTLFGHQRSFWNSVALTFGILSCKFHGIYLAGFVGLLLILGLLRRSFQKKHLFKKPNFQEKLALISGIILCSSVYGLNWIQYGDPLFPFLKNKLGGEPLIRTLDYLGVFGAFSFWDALKNPLRTMIYPGVIALKAAAVLLIPALLICPFVKKKRFIGFACVAFCTSLIWIAIAHSTLEDSRFARYAFGLTTLGLCFFAIALVNALKRVLPKISQIHFLHFFLGAVLLTWTVMTVDTRYSNVPPTERPKWKDIAQLMKSYWDHKPSEVQIKGAMMPYLFPQAVSNLQKLEPCLDKYGKISKIRLKDGEHLLLMSSFGMWPGYFLGGLSLRGDIYGGGFLKMSMENFQKLPIEYALLPREWLNTGKIPLGYVQNVPGLSQKILQQMKRVLCQSDDLVLVKM